MCDWEMIDRVAEVLRKHHIMTQPTAAIIALEFIKAMREPTEKMMKSVTNTDGFFKESDPVEAWHKMIDAVLND